MFQSSARRSEAATKPSRLGGFVVPAWRIIARYGFFALLIALALPTGLVAIAEGARLMALPFNLFVVDQALPGTFRVHMLASGAVLVLIPLVLILRRERPWHRWLGRITAALVVAGALTSFPVAWESGSPLAARLGFAAQGLVWLALVVAGVRAARARNFTRHATFMLAMSAVASGAIWVRLMTAIVVACRLPFDPIYGAAAWAGWLLPMAIVFALRTPSPRPLAFAR